MDEPVSAPAAPEPAAATTAGPHDKVARIAAIAAIVAVVAVGWLAWDARSGVNAIEATAGGRLAGLGAGPTQGKAPLAPSQSALEGAQARLAERQARPADTPEQRPALAGK